ncbi:tetratricopeptide repeat protein [Candidatus Amarolinea aalborgensis]|uniref:tetratricopeptide repeat protein n=1 Tax=Candidatus Amarolinea aalborgensis TaxID=2249329 RepID=UPI003BF968B3
MQTPIELQAVYIPMDRRQAIAAGVTLPEQTTGAALFVDISGFTPLTEALAQSLGPQLGAEELTRYLNQVYDTLIAELDCYGGSVIGFSGDAITCWFDGDNGLRATACALAMQEAMRPLQSVPLPSAGTISLAVKATVAVGPVRRFVVGDHAVQVVDVLSGATLDRLAEAEHHADKGEVLLDATAVAAVGDAVIFGAWRARDHSDAQTEESPARLGVVASIQQVVEPRPWPPLPADALSEPQVRPWLLPAVYERLRTGGGEFLAELRPAVSLFLRFGGLDYDDDESVGSKLDQFICEVQRLLARYAATLLQIVVGDKGSYLFAAFGAPHAHEDDAARALSAALELRALAASLDYLTPVQIGIARGRMRTGAYGGVTRRTYGVMGDAANVAARLMQAAKPGQILVTDAVQLTAGAGFAWEDLPAIRVKGKSLPIAIASLIGRRRKSALGVHETGYALPMVGRKSELALIESRLAAARAGQGQIITIMGEAGMGKSRLVAEVIRVAGDRGFSSFAGECESYGTNSSYLVWQNIWRGLLSVDSDALEETAGDDTHETTGSATNVTTRQIERLETSLRQIDPTLVPRLPLLGLLLNLSIPDNDLTRTFDAKLRKTSLEALLVDCLRALAATTPLLIILEDAHWIDALSQDLLEALGQTLVDLPILLVMTFRPPTVAQEQAPKLSRLPGITQITLGEFSPAEAAQLIALKIGQRAQTEGVAPISADHLPAALVERILERADGNPFYIEELLNYIQARGIALDDTQAIAQLDLPVSLHSLILSRIDQLSESQQITLKAASVIGRLFGSHLLRGVHPSLGEHDRVQRDLETLASLDLMALERTEPDTVYFFKHLVTQEVAYESLPYATRATLHGQLGQFVEETYYESLDSYLDLLAFHYARSNNITKQREYFLKAGQAAQARYANSAAIDYYQRVLPMLSRTERMGVLLSLGQVFELVGNWREANELYTEALGLAADLQDSLTAAWCQVRLGENCRKQARFVEAWQWLTTAQRGFEALADKEGLGQVLHYLGTLADQQGDYASAQAHYLQSLTLRREVGDQPRVASLLSNLAIVARRQGNLPEARRLHEESLTIRRSFGDRWAIGVSLNNLGNVLLDLGNYGEALPCFEEALALMRQVGDRWTIANFLNNLGNAARSQRDDDRAHALYRESLLIYRGFEDKWALAYLLEDIGCLLALEGKPTPALRLIGAAAALRAAIGVPLSGAEQARLDRLLASALGPIDSPAHARAWAQGRALSQAEAINEALDQL